MNLRKMLSLVLAALLLAIPALSLGESAASPSFLDKAYDTGRNVKTTITFAPGSIFAMDPNMSAVADLLKALKLESSSQNQEKTSLHQLDVLLQDKPALSSSLLAKDNELHILSSLLSGKVLSFTPEELVNLYIMMLESSAESAPLDPSQLDRLRASLNEALQAGDASTILSSQNDPYLGFDPEILQKDLIDPLITWFEGALAKGETTTGTFESDKHDDAAAQKVSVISAAQLKEALEIFAAWAVQDKNLERLTEMANSSNTADTAYSKEDSRLILLSMPDEFEKKAGRFLPKPITITEWTDASGVRKALEIKAEIVGETGTFSLLLGQYEKTEEDGIVTRVDIDASAGLDGLTISFADKKIPVKTEGDAAVAKSQWKLTGSYKQGGLPLGSLTLAFDRTNAAAAAAVQDNWSLGLELNASSMAISASIKGSEKTVTDGADAKAEGTVDLYVFDPSTPALTIAYTTASGEPAALPEIPADSVRLGKMTQEELEAWTKEIEPVVQGQMMVIMGNLPPSIIKLIMGSTTPK